MRCVSVIALALMPSARTAGAQTANADCLPRTLEAVTAAPWGELRPSRMAARLKPLMEGGEWVAVGDSLRILYSTASNDWAGLDPAQHATLIAELDSLQAELVAVQRNPDLLARGVFAERFKPTFLARSREQVLFNGRGETMVLRVTDSLPEATRRGVCWLGWSASDVIAVLRHAGLVRLSTAFHKLDLAWDNYMNHGYSMMPLELLVNGLFVPRAQLEPPNAQIVLGHVSVASQMFATSLDNANRDEVLAVEPIGYLRYTGDRADYFGASAIMTYPKSGGVGLGAMLHWSKLGHLGVIWQKPQGQGRRIGALVSMDLYQRIVGASEKLKGMQKDKTGQCLFNEATCAAALPQ